MAKVSKTAVLPAPDGAPSSRANLSVGTTTTQRAYTLRLRPAISDGDDIKEKRHELQEALWATHEAINNGAKAFGEWLLTLRGGLDHRLADAPGKKGQSPGRDEVRDRRVLLALSWLTVEDERGAPKDPGLIVAYGQECTARQHGKAERDELVVAALRGVLGKRGLKPDEIVAWIADCEPSLTARIRGDAVWVNRSEAFDLRAIAISPAVSRDEVWDVLDWIFKPREDYCHIGSSVHAPTPSAATTEPEGDVHPAGPAKPKELTKDAGSWLVLRFPKAAGADFSAVLNQYRKIDTLLKRDGLVGLSGAAFAQQVADVMDVSDTTKQTLERSFTYSGAKKGSGFFRALATVLASEGITAGELDDLAVSVVGAIERFSSRQGARDVTPRGARALSNAILATVARDCGFEYSPPDSAKFHFEYCVMIGMAAERLSAHHSWCKLAEAERRAFEADAAKIAALTTEHPAAVAFLEAFRESRGRDTGSLGGEPLLIRKRAIAGWKDVVVAWGRAGCITADDRVAAMRALQDELEKFGDHTLFERIAADEAKVVWQRADGTPDHTILSRYVEGTVAQSNQQRFKVPAYRHPDPLRAPIFGRFGNSQWKIDFAVRRRVGLATKGKRPSRDDAAYLASDHNMRLGLWTGQRVENVNLRWSSKRLSADLGLRNLTGDSDAIVTRADRLGRAASDVTGAVNVASVFAEGHWNGRLQAPRAELDRIARLLDKGKVESAAKAKARLSWLVTFSPKLAPAGPFIDYAAEHGIPASKKGEYYPNSDVNKADKREGHAKLMLARLPGLRVLSVDLGHRFAAACAAWETMSAATFKRAVANGAVAYGGSGPDDLFCHVRTKVSDGRERTTIYRRIGSDTLPDGTSHPAPWAKLDRQFLIKLQGEDDTPRKMSPAELTMLDGWRKALGAAELPAAHKPRNVAEGMAESARFLTLAVRRHADRARIAHNLTATTRTRPGGQPETLDHAGRVHEGGALLGEQVDQPRF